MSRRTNKAPTPGRVRIVGGSLRGRRIAVPDAPGLRPTPDRMRETLFNWLAPLIEGARCLDLFAGSGALGLEAASRGAGEVVMVERDPRIAAHLATEVDRLLPPSPLRERSGGEGDPHALDPLPPTGDRRPIGKVRVIRTDALAWLDTADEPFDIVFLDPPFRQGLVARAIERLAARRLLRPGGRVYIETEDDLPEPALPEGWALLRTKRAGQVTSRLVGIGEAAEA